MFLSRLAMLFYVLLDVPEMYILILPFGLLSLPLWFEEAASSLSVRDVL